MSSQLTLSITSDITEIKLHERKQPAKQKQTKKHKEKRSHHDKTQTQQIWRLSNVWQKGLHACIASGAPKHHAPSSVGWGELTLCCLSRWCGRDSRVPPHWASRRKKRPGTPPGTASHHLQAATQSMRKEQSDVKPRAAPTRDLRGSPGGSAGPALQAEPIHCTGTSGVSSSSRDSHIAPGC